MFSLLRQIFSMCVSIALREVMPKYFKMGSYASFQRQLNLYSFTRIAEGPERGSYFHNLFVKDKPLLSTTMKRKEVKKPATKQALESKPELAAAAP